MSETRIWCCDRCGFEMVERHCKVIFPNCGQRWDCSDATIWVGDDRMPSGARRQLNTVQEEDADRPTG